MDEILTGRLFDLRDLDVALFPAWLERHLPAWQQDPVFQQRRRIRELRRSTPRLQELEEERRLARAAYEECELYAEIEARLADIDGASKAVAGLNHAMLQAMEGPRRQRLSRKLLRFRNRLEKLEQEMAELTSRCSERQEVERVQRELISLREEVGFTEEIARLDTLHKAQGRGSGRSGSSFETAAIAAVRREILPELSAGEEDEPLVILKGVKLGAAQTEIDQLIVRESAVPGEPVEVLGMVEAKRNPNDLAHGFKRRLENAAWLTGHATGYDSERYRAAAYPTGHFEGVGIHLEGGRRFSFTRDSFRYLLPDIAAGAVPRHLYFVTRATTLWGIGSGGLARLAHRVSSDVDWSLEDPKYLAGLLEWAKGLTQEVEAPEVLGRYARDEIASGNVLFLAEP